MLSPITRPNNCGVLRQRPSKQHTRFPADFAVTEKEIQWQCPLKSTLTFELSIELQDFPNALEKSDYAHTRTITDSRLFEIPVTEILDRIFSKEHQWQCVLKSTPSLELVIVLLNFAPRVLPKTTEAGQKLRHTSTLQTPGFLRSP